MSVLLSSVSSVLACLGLRLELWVMSQLARKSQMSPRGWRCLIMSQFNLKKYADVKKTWARSTSPEVR